VKHLKENNQTYVSHIKFAWRIALHMLVSSCFLLIHGLLPFVPIPKLFSLEGMTHKMKKWDNYVKVTKFKKEKY
tara:strand:+ start:333 stop:554 length:222 start_codon:yes stop_codon:yes gene_type:complete